MRIQAAVVIAIAALSVPAGVTASGRDGGGDVRVRGTCAGARTELETPIPATAA